MSRKPGSKEEAVLQELCTRFGYCLPIAAQIEIVASASRTPSALVDAVVMAEGLDPTTVRHRAEMIERAAVILDSPVWSSKP